MCLDAIKKISIIDCIDRAGNPKLQQVMFNSLANILGHSIFSANPVPNVKLQPNAARSVSLGKLLPLNPNSFIE